jgi:hypothetical protein
MIVLRLLIEKWTVKALQMRFQIEIRNKLQNTGGKAILVIMW